MEKKVESWDIPKSINWYLDGTKWLVGISTGSLIFGFGFFKDSAPSIYEKIVFGSSVLFFSISSFSGVFTYFWLTSYTNLRESNRAKNYVKELSRRLDNMNRWYQMMLNTFRVAIILFGIFCLMKLYLSTPKIQSDTKIKVIKLDGDFPKTIIFNEKTGGFWEIHQDTVGILTLVPIPIPEGFNSNSFQ